IGAPVYIRGFLRTYARFLGLDPEEVVAVFNGAPLPAARPASEPPGSQPDYPRGPAPQTAPEPRRGGGAWVIWAAALVAVALIAFVVYNEVTMHRDTISSANSATNIATDTSPSPEATPSGLASATPAPGASGASPLPSGVPPPDAGPKSLALVLSAPSW